MPMGGRPGPAQRLGRDLLAELSPDPQRDLPILLFTATEPAPEVAGAVAPPLIKTRATPGELAATVDELLRR